MVKHPEMIEVLKTIPIFLDLKPFQLARLASAVSVIELDPDFQLITEGDPLDYTYILLEGEMTVKSFVPSIGNFINYFCKIIFLTEEYFPAFNRNK